jgi:hypothetical protein
MGVEEAAGAAAGAGVLELVAPAESLLEDEPLPSLEEPAELPESLPLSLFEDAGLALP